MRIWAEGVIRIMMDIRRDEGMKYPEEETETDTDGKQETGRGEDPLLHHERPAGAAEPITAAAP